MIRFALHSFTLLTVFSTCMVNSHLSAQDESDQPTGVVIERAALTLTSPEKYSIALKLQPVRSLPVVAPTDGIVSEVFVKAGDSVRSQSEIIRLDSQEFSLALKTAQAGVELAKIELVQQSKIVDGKAIAEAKLKVAQSELDLAQFRVDETVLRSAIDGTVTETHVTKGQYVRAGDLLAIVIDPQKLFVEVPVERDQAEKGKSFPLTIEANTTEATIDAVLPPRSEFDPLRELFVSVATARLLIDSKGGQFTTGQSVASKMIPRFPLAEIQTLAIRTATDDPDAERSVQVIRDGFVRSLPIQVLGQVGQTHVFVSARFTEGDELIVSSSESLKDGSWVRPMLLKNPEGRPATQRNLPRPNLPPNSGF